MLTALFLSLALVVPAGDFLPGEDDVRMRTISRSQDETGWPFVAVSGVLVCVPVLMKPLVYFVAETPSGKPTAGPYHIAEDIAGMAFANLGMTGVLKPYDNLEQLVVRLTPYIAMGKRLCNLKPGTVLPETVL